MGLVTLGIYDDPLVVYREYSQNAVDALESSGQTKTGKIEIAIEPKQRRVSIRDNGPGLTYQECIENLIPIGRSKKVVGQGRGFRGIGRLAGLAFADSVTFLTRAEVRGPITRVVWSGVHALDWTTSAAVTEDTVQNCVSIDTLEDANRIGHFFEVQLDRVSRQAGGVLLNRDAVRKYISEVCPVPMSESFPFHRDVQIIFGPDEVPVVQDIVVGDDPEPLRRQYEQCLRFTDERSDEFQEFQMLQVPSLDRTDNAAVGWIAHSSYLGAIPKRCGVRGVRARVGNIQIGGESIFDHLFPEERFNRWCVGELHILDKRILPNARRDYFEPNPHLRNLENHLGPVFRRLASRCRSASSARNKQAKILAELFQVEEMCDLLTSGCLSPGDIEELTCATLAQISDLRGTLRTMGFGDEPLARASETETKLRHLDPCQDHRFSAGVPPEDVGRYQKMFRAVIDVSTSPAHAKRIIESFLQSV